MPSSPLITRLIGRVVCMCFGYLLATPWVTAATIEFAPEVEAGTGYTDNIRLASEDEESEWLGWVRPSFIFSREAERLNLAARYALDAFLYGGSDTNLSHQFSGSAIGELIRNTMFLDVTGSRSQGIVDPNGSYSFSNLPRSGNRTDITNFNVRPYVRQQFGQNGLASLSYEYGQVWYDDSEAQDTKRHLVNGDIGIWEQDYGLTWESSYSYTKVEYDVSQDFEYQLAYLRLGYWVTRAARLFGAYGLETDYEDLDSSGLDEQSWEVGIELAPNQRFNLEVAAGERAWGSSYRGSLRYSADRITTDISYSEEPYTPGLDGYSRVPFPEDDDSDGFLDRPGAGGRYVNKEFNWRTRYDLPKSSWTLRLFQTKKEDIILDDTAEIDPDELENEEERGVSLRWSWDAGSRTQLSILGQYTKREFADTGGKDDLWRLAGNVEYELGPRTFANLTYQYAKQDPDNSDGGSGYTANTIGIWFKRTF